MPLKKLRIKSAHIALIAAALLACLGYYAYTVGALPAQISDNIGQWALALLLIAAVLFTMMGGRERVPNRRAGFSTLELTAAVSKLTFADVAANQEARESLRGMVDFLGDPEKYARIGARMPRGVLLYGPPGTGKTLLARALAGEAGVPFYALAGSDFVQMYVGVGAGRVRDLFVKARKAGKCVIFIDELDALGKRRDESGTDERDQTLNALLAEMSGFRENEGILVVAATNRLESLDPALLRPGRFDRQIEVALPGVNERRQILELHARGKRIAGDVDLSALAADTVGFSGASLESLLNEAAICAAQRGADCIAHEDVRGAFFEALVGKERESMKKQERLMVALHEAGHALATRHLLPEHRVPRVSIIPTGKGAAGYSMAIPPDHGMLSQAQLSAQIQVLLAGRAAEQLIAGEDDITTGAGNDLARATQLMSAMVLELGMQNSGPVSLRALAQATGSMPQEAAQRCKQALAEHYGRVTRLLSENTDALMRITEALVAQESLTQAELDVLIGEKAA